MPFADAISLQPAVVPVVGIGGVKTLPDPQVVWGMSFTSRQPMGSGVSCTAGRTKKDWGSAGSRWGFVLAMGVAA